MVPIKLGAPRGKEGVSYWAGHSEGRELFLPSDWGFRLGPPGGWGSLFLFPQHPSPGPSEGPGARGSASEPLGFGGPAPSWPPQSQAEAMQCRGRGGISSLWPLAPKSAAHSLAAPAFSSLFSRGALLQGNPWGGGGGVVLSS